MTVNVSAQWKKHTVALKSPFYWLIKGDFLFISEVYSLEAFFFSLTFIFFFFLLSFFSPPTGLERFHLNEHSGSIVWLWDETCRRQLSRDVLWVSCHRGTEGRSEGKGFDGRKKRTWRLRGERQGTWMRMEEEEDGPVWLCFPERETKHGCIIKQQRLFFYFLFLRLCCVFLFSYSPLWMPFLISFFFPKLLFLEHKLQLLLCNLKNPSQLSYSIID